MKYYVVQDGVIINIPVVDFENPNSIAFAEKQKWAMGPKGYTVGDLYDVVTNQFTHVPTVIVPTAPTIEERITAAEAAVLAMMEVQNV